MKKLFSLVILFVALAGFTDNPVSTLSPRTLMMDAANQNGQIVEVMGVVDAIQKINGTFSFGYYYEVRLYLDGNKTLVVIAMTPQIPLRLINGTLVKIKGTFYTSGVFDKHTYKNYIIADKIFSLDAI